MAITRKDVLHVARLARLSLAEAEIDDLIRELGRILEYVELLREVDTTGVPATCQMTVAAAPLRDDAVSTLLDRELVLAEAPRRTGEGFAVPAFVEEG
ncbi:MAG TPA: Asp-tRNA(Asn)/Glu-tRNA(Gln) amidotransferase subunit GatC [Polyangiaceae bacterium]|nr:Asp-tRNA(Asn)/Glu-tRNA(Gln) amidotransferase subunit GatC [Polyangiaceae bacterium]